MVFHDERFPTEISFGSSGGPKRNIDVVELASGQEIRRNCWKQARRSYDAGSGVRALEDIYEILRFFEAREGRMYGFRWRDWLDWKSCEYGGDVDFRDQMIGRGDDVEKEFQLVKRYGYEADASARVISKPVMGTVLVGIHDRLCDASEYSVDYLSGKVHFAHPPESGAPIYAGYQFDVPVRFDCEALDINLANFEAGEAPHIPVVEIFE